MLLSLFPIPINIDLLYNVVETGNTHRLLMKLKQTALKFQQQIWGLRPRDARKKCRKVIAAAIKNRG